MSGRASRKLDRAARAQAARIKKILRESVYAHLPLFPSLSLSILEERSLLLSRNFSGAANYRAKKSERHSMCIYDVLD